MYINIENRKYLLTCFSLFQLLKKHGTSEALLDCKCITTGLHFSSFKIFVLHLIQFLSHFYDFVICSTVFRVNPWQTTSTSTCGSHVHWAYRRRSREPDLCPSGWSSLSWWWSLCELAFFFTAHRTCKPNQNFKTCCTVGS